MKTFVTRTLKNCPVCGLETEHFSLNGGVVFCSKCLDRGIQIQEMADFKKSYDTYRKDLLTATGCDMAVIVKVNLPEAVDFAKGQGKLNLFLFGSVGRGKTTTACFIALSKFKQGIKAKYCKAYDAVADLKPYINCKLLILDELHKAVALYGDKPSEKDRQSLYRLVEHRRNHNLSTIFISNFDKNSLISLLGEDTYDRISDKNKTTGVYFSGESYRQESK